MILGGDSLYILNSKNTYTLNTILYISSEAAFSIYPISYIEASTMLFHTNSDEMHIASNIDASHTHVGRRAKRCWNIFNLQIA